MGKPIRSHRDLDVYKAAKAICQDLFELTKQFPDEERYLLRSQLRRSSRSVRVNIVEAWRKRRYEAAFVLKLSDAETEAVESQEHIEVALECSYITRTEAVRLFRAYERIIKTLVGMIRYADRWTIRDKGDAAA